jgi:hypothetical protein
MCIGFANRPHEYCIHTQKLQGRQGQRTRAFSNTAISSPSVRQFNFLHVNSVSFRIHLMFRVSAYLFRLAFVFVFFDCGRGFGFEFNIVCGKAGFECWMSSTFVSSSALAFNATPSLAFRLGLVGRGLVIEFDFDGRGTGMDKMYFKTKRQACTPSSTIVVTILTIWDVILLSSE